MQPSPLRTIGKGVEEPRVLLEHNQKLDIGSVQLARFSFLGFCKSHPGLGALRGAGGEAITQPSRGRAPKWGAQSHTRG